MNNQEKLNAILEERWELESQFQEEKIGFSKFRKGSAVLGNQYNDLMIKEYKESELDYSRSCPCGLLHTHETKALIATDRVR